MGRFSDVCYWQKAKLLLHLSFCKHRPIISLRCIGGMNKKCHYLSLLLESTPNIPRSPCQVFFWNNETSINASFDQTWLKSLVLLEPVIRCLEGAPLEPLRSVSWFRCSLNSFLGQAAMLDLSSTLHNYTLLST